RCQRERQVHCHGGFADTALGGGHGDHIAYAGHELNPALHGVRDDLEVDVDLDLACAGQRAQRLFKLLTHCCELALRRIAQHDIDGDVATAHRDFLDLLT